MSQTDPYAPPQSSLSGMTPAEIAARHSGARNYPALWRRGTAFLIDMIVMSPSVVFDYLFAGEARVFQLYNLILGQFLIVYFYVFFVVKMGATPGKLLLGLHITKEGGAPVTAKDAVLRYGVMWLITLASSVMMVMGAFSLTEEAYHAMEWSARLNAMLAQVPGSKALNQLWLIWLVACAISLLASKQRRALHDFIAGTVVVRK